MFHWIGAPRWAVIFLLILISASVIILAYFIVERGKEPVLTYTRSGGVAGFADKLVIYQDGEAVLSSRNQ
jgi:predicted ABC-type sugar transport system permease subunit